MSERETTGAAPTAAPPAPPTAVAAPTAGAAPAMPAPDRPNMRRIFLINGLGLVVLILIALGIYYLWHQGYYFYSTDDATVTGNVVSIAAPAPATIQAVYHGVGSTIHAGDTVATLRSASGSTLRATTPINGTIINASATPGEVLPAGQPMAQVVDLNKLAITAYVEENHISDVHTGQGVDVTVDAVKSTTFHGTVTQILPATASTFSALPTTDYASGNFTKVTQRVPVQITLDGYQGHSLYPGESASVTIHIHS
jgi:multidrug resistance efflux pump